MNGNFRFRERESWFSWWKSKIFPGTNRREPCSPFTPSPPLRASLFLFFLPSSRPPAIHPDHIREKENFKFEKIYKVFEKRGKVKNRFEPYQVLIFRSAEINAHTLTNKRKRAGLYGSSGITFSLLVDSLYWQSFKRSLIKVMKRKRSFRCLKTRSKQINFKQFFFF